MKLLPLCALMFAALLCQAGHAAVVRVNIDERITFKAAEVPALDRDYEKLQGTVHFAFDPDNPANRAIVDIALAPRNQHGQVEARANFMVLQPRAPDQRSGIAFLEVSNRGGKASLRYFNRATTRTSSPTTPADFGDGLLMRHGMTVIWVGWQFDVPGGPERLRLHVPVARQGRQPIAGLVRSDWVVDSTAHTLALGHRDHWAYPVADARDPRNVLTRRRGRDEPRVVVPRATWRFARAQADAVVSDRSHIHSASGFAGGYIYELVYVAEEPRVVGLGLAAVRDMLAYAKYHAGSLFPVTHGVGFGVSQTGRFLRHFLYQGFNADERGRRVFDGMLIHTAGAGRGSFNHRFAQPSRDGHRYSAFFYPTDLFPFTGRVQTDAVTGQRGGLLAIYPRADLVPKIMYTNTGYEYWGRAGALIHVSPDGKRDVAPMANERIYHLASGQHFVGRWPPSDDVRVPGARAWRSNPLDFLVNLRALAVRLAKWVKHGHKPPASRYPKLADGTLVTVPQLRFPKMAGVTLPGRAHVAYRADYGARWGAGIVDKQPPELGSAFPALVPQVDSSGNELGGVRNVEIRVPVATYTPWQLRSGLPRPEEIANFRGLFMPFYADAQAARAGGDTRPAVLALYANRAAYAAKVDSAAAALVQEGFLLAEDQEFVRQRNLALWDAVMASSDSTASP